MAGKENRNNSLERQVEISISEDNEELSEKHKHEKTNTISEHPNHSTASFGDDELERCKIISVQIEEHRILRLINKKDQDLYKKIDKYVDENPGVTVEDTILKFGRSSDALAKVAHNYPLPDFILRYKNETDEEILEKKEKGRENFEVLLLRSGLILEHETDPEGMYTYVKIIAPFETLCEVAQEIKLKMRINNDNLPEDFSVLDQYDYKVRSTIVSKIIDLFTYKINLKKESSFFKIKDLKSFEGADKNDAEIALNFFNTSRRSLLVHRLIITANHINKKISSHEKTIYVKRKIESLGIKKLIERGYYIEFYPIHDGSSKLKGDLEKNNLRAQLNEIWFKQGLKRQPLNKIRAYFGEKVALYFAWLGFYTSWLSIASIAGIIVVIYGIIYAARANELAGIERISAVWDNALTVPYALLMAIWATLFLETWKRVNASIQYDWDVIDYEKEELPRPEFYGTTLRVSPITFRKEIHFPYKEKMVKILISIAIVLISIAIVIVTVGVLIKFPTRWFKHLGFLAPAVTAIVNLATIIILNIYKNVATKLTSYENQKTETQFEDSLILKAYLFDFVNFYSVLIYMVFSGSQLCRDTCRDDICLNNCIDQSKGLTRLTIQLAIIFIGKQLFGQITEILIPWLMGKWNKARVILERDLLEKKYAESGRKLTCVPQWVEDDHLAQSTDSIRTEYEEIVIQFGFLALFGVAFPLAPLFAWINNVTEIRSDAFKYLKTLQRPVGHQAQDLGMWEKLLTIISFIAVLTNAIIIAFHSLWMERQFIKMVGNDEDKLLIARLGFVIAFEHLVLIIKLAFAYVIPDLPSKVRIAIEREQYLSKLILKNEPPALDEYWNDGKDDDDDSLFSEGGTLLLPKSKTQ